MLSQNGWKLSLVVSKKDASYKKEKKRLVQMMMLNNNLTIVSALNINKYNFQVYSEI
jgi:hypothetical protein